jgi:branched-subunit amino acid aminotransferase/4-amino-4-deoxychorismate lyase
VAVSVWGRARRSLLFRPREHFARLSRPARALAIGFLVRQLHFMI